MAHYDDSIIPKLTIFSALSILDYYGKATIFILWIILCHVKDYRVQSWLSGRL